MKTSHVKIIFGILLAWVVAISLVLFNIKNKAHEIATMPKQKNASDDYSKETWNVKQTEVDTQFADIAKLLESARAVPVREGDEILGFKVLDIQPGSMWDQVGLKNNDIITHINDEAMNSAANGMNIYSTLKETKDWKVEIQRAKETRILNIKIQ